MLNPRTGITDARRPDIEELGFRTIQSTKDEALAQSICDLHIRSLQTGLEPRALRLEAELEDLTTRGQALCSHHQRAEGRARLLGRDLRRLACAAGLGALATTSACADGAARTVCAAVGACDDEQRTSAVVTVLLDGSLGAPGARETLDTVVTQVLRALVDLPQSRIDVAVLGANVEDTRIAATYVVPMPRKRGGRAASVARARALDGGRAALLNALVETHATSRPSRSPLLEAVGKLALVAPHERRPWTIILVSDLLEMSDLGRWECGELPDTAALRRTLQQRSVLTPGMLSGARVLVAYHDVRPIDGRRCHQGVGRALRVRELWGSVLSAAGAADVRFYSGPAPADAINTDAVEPTVSDRRVQP